MPLSSITAHQLALLIFFLLSLLVSFCSKRIRTLPDYILTSKNLGSGVLLITLLSSVLPISNLGIRAAFESGFISLTPTILMMLTALFVGYIIFPRLYDFKEHYTIAEIMEELYGTHAALFTKIICTFFSLLFITVQLKCFIELAPFFGLSPTLLILLIGIFLVFQILLCSINVLTGTEILRFLLIGSGIFFVAATLLYQAGGSKILFAKIAKGGQHFIFSTYPERFRSLLVVFFSARGYLLFISPPVIQRILLMRKTMQIRTILMGCSGIYLFFKVCFFLIGLCLVTLYPSLTGVEVGNLGKILELLSQNRWVQIVFSLLLLAAFLSTTESFINSLAFLWIAPKTKKSIGGVERFALLFTLIVGLLAILLQNFSIARIEFAAFFAYSLLLIPFLAGVYGLKTTPYMFWLPIAVLFCCIVCLNTIPLSSVQQLFLFFGLPTFFYSDKVYFSFFICCFSLTINFLVYFSVHYYQHGKRFILINRNPYGFQEEEESYFQWNFFSWLHSPMTWSHEKIAICGKKSYALGIFIYINYLAQTLLKVGAKESFSFILLRSIGLFLATGLLLEKLWPRRLEKYFNIFYFFSLAYCVPFITLITSFENSKGSFIVLHVTLAVIILRTLVDWSTFLLLGSIASFAATILYCLHYNFFFARDAMELIFFLAASCYTFIFCFFFIRKSYLEEREKAYLLHHKASESERQLKLALFTQQQLVTSIDTQSSMMQVIERSLQELKDLGSQNKAPVNRIKDAISHLAHIAFQAQAYLPLDLKNLSISSFIKKVLTQVKELTELPSSHIQLIYRSNAREAIWDPRYFMKLVSNSWQLLSREVKEEPIVMVLTDTALNYKIGNQDQRLPALHIQIAPKRYGQLPVREDYACTFGDHNAYKDEDPLTQENKAIVDTHYGRFLYAGHVQFAYILPLNVKVLRPKIECFADEVILSNVMLHEEEDQHFLRAIQKAGVFDYNLIRQALQVAKHYHRKQKRHTGEPFYLHPLAVATILLPYTTENEIIVAALLHDTIEDTAYSLSQLKAMFGRKVAQLVANVTLLYSNGTRKMKMSKKESILSLLLKSNPDILLIKLADRLHNMRTVYVQPPEKQRRIAEETLHIFIPAAEALGLSAIAEELKRMVATILPEEILFHESSNE